MLNLLLATLSLWRITSLFTKEKGPFLAFYHLREWAGIEHDDDYKPLGYDESKPFGEVLYCPWCFSMMFGLLWGLLWATAPNLMSKVSLPFALSAGAIITQERVIHGKG